MDAFDVGSEEKSEVKGRLSPWPEPLEGWSGHFLGLGTMQNGVSGSSGVCLWMHHTQSCLLDIQVGGSGGRFCPSGAQLG